MRDERAVVVGALIADTAGDILGEGAPLVHGDYVAAGILELASLHLLQRGHEQRVLVIGPLALALPLAWRVEAVVVLVLILFPVVPSLDTRLGPALDEFVQGVELHLLILLLIILGGSIGAFGHGLVLFVGGLLGGLVRGGLRLGLVSLVRGGLGLGLALRSLLFLLLLEHLLPLLHRRDGVVEPQASALGLVGLDVADEVNAVAHLLHGFVGVILPEARVVLVPVLLLLVVGRVRVNIDLGVAAAAEDPGAPRELLFLGLALPSGELLGALLLRNHGADGVQEGEAVLLFGESVGGLELVVIADAEDHLGVLLGQAVGLVGHDELVDLLLRGLLLESLEASLERLEPLLDDLLLLGG